MAINYLISRGHRRIGIIPGPEMQPFSEARLQGWRSALEGADIAVDQALVSYGDYSVEGGRSAISRLIELRSPPTAVLAGNFHEVVGVLQVLRERSMHRNGRIELVASHDSAALDAFDPPITSVDQPVQEIGLNAAELLLRRIRQPMRPAEHVLLRPRLRIRATAPAAVSAHR
jgi:DNA-binding LacI/PurR family transcriptional regulator